jgi:hypothetical protein
MSKGKRIKGEDEFVGKRYHKNGNVQYGQFGET